MLACGLARPGAAEGAEPPARDGGPAGRSARLQWQRMAGAEGCISGEELAAALQRRLRRGTIGGPEADVTLEGTIAPAESGQGYKAWVVVRDRSDQSLGTREVSSVESSCRGLDEALLLVLSVIIDPSLAFEPGPAPPPAPAQGAARGARRPSETSWHVAAGVGASVGLVPGLGLGAQANAGVRLWGGPIVEVGGVHWFGNRVDSNAGGATVSTTYGAVNVCWLPYARGRWELGGCLGGQGGVVRVDASGFAGRSLEPSRPIANVAARAEARLSLGDPFFGRLTLGGALPLVRDRFFFSGQGGEVVSLFRLSPLSAGLGLEGGVTFR
ncbi:MAG TPA: hypothetical protein VFS43_17835 [Polyangiaceae bacterium]|nr:hypothetical protein [Polyangiaceae bacterium]